MMKGISVEEIQSRISALDLDIKKIELLRKKLQERCALHGSSISMSSKMMSMIDILMEDSDLVAGAPD